MKKTECVHVEEELANKRENFPLSGRFAGKSSAIQFVEWIFGRHFNDADAIFRNKQYSTSEFFSSQIRIISVKWIYCFSFLWAKVSAVARERERNDDECYWELIYTVQINNQHNENWWRFKFGFNGLLFESDVGTFW